MSIPVGTYVDATVSYSWGVSPGSASVNMPGDWDAAEPGDEIVLNLGGTTFQGVVMARNPGASGLGGTFTRVEIADNRIHLQWDVTKCVFNMTEVRADNPATPGIDRQRRYWSIKPDSWNAQIKTWWRTPIHAATIVDIITTSTTENPCFEWDIADPDNLLKAPVYEIDANNGTKVGSLLTEICGQLGIVFTCVGTNTLKFARKGDGTAPYINPATEASYSGGTSLSHADTHIQVIGGRNVYQDVVTLEPWWNNYWNPFVPEWAWLAEVDRLWGSEWAGETDPEVKALRRSIKSRQVTLRDYQLADGDGNDFGMWGEVCRMEMPVWLYLRDIVWRAYRVPRNYVLSFAGIGDTTLHLGVQSLEFHEHLLAACNYDATEGDISRLDPPQWYPPDAAFILAKGFRVSALDPKLVKVITAEEMGRSRTVWAPQNGFTLDPRPESLGVIFDEPLALDSTEHPFFKWKNHGKAGISTTHTLYNVVVPNADGFANAQPPQVKMAIAWRANKYTKKFGSGKRWGVAHSDGIAGHYITRDGVVTDEVPWPDGDDATTVDAKAAEFAAKLLGQQEYFDVGSITRKGGMGTALNGVVDKVTVKVDFAGGWTETIDLTKERQPVTYYNNRLLDRMARFHDLFQGQRANRIEIQTKQAQIAMKRLKTEQVGAVIKTLQHAMSFVAGNEHPALQKVLLTGAVAAGQALWRNATSGLLSPTGTVFAGIITAAGLGAGAAEAATQGIVPVRVKGPFTAGDSVGVNGSNDYAEVNGERSLSRLLATYTGTDTVLAPVQLGAGGGGGGPPTPRPFAVLPYSPTQVRVVESTVLGERPDGMSNLDTPEFHLTVAAGNEVYLVLTFDNLTGECTSRTVGNGASLPADSPSTHTYYIALARIAAGVGAPRAAEQYRYGPIEHFALSLPQSPDGDIGTEILHDIGSYGFRTLKARGGMRVEVDPANDGRVRMTGCLRGFEVLQDGAGYVWVMQSTVFGLTPYGMYPGDDPKFTLVVGNGDKIYVKVIFDLDGDPYSATVEKAASVPADVASTRTFHIPLCTVAVADGVITTDQTRYGPIEFFTMDLPIESDSEKGVSVLGSPSNDEVQGRGGHGLRTLRGRNGINIEVDPDNTGRLLFSGRVLPFQVEGRRLTDEASTPQLRVTHHSRLLGSITPDDTLAITDLGEWKNVTSGSQIVFLRLDSDAMTARVYVEEQVNSVWLHFPEPIEWVNRAAVNKVQKGAFVLIGYLYGSAPATEVAAFNFSSPLHPDPEYWFIQCLSTDLLVAQMCFAGFNVKYPAPWHGAKKL